LPNEKVEQLAANNLTIPQDAIASLLQRLVRHALVAGGPSKRPHPIIAANRFSTPQDIIAILLQGFVRHSLFISQAHSC
jgi:hypothetical protein